MNRCTVLWLAFPLCLACGGGGTKGSPTPCTDDSNCQRGYVCKDGFCQKVECTDASECGSADRICVTIPGPGFDPNKKYCTKIECNAQVPCPDGQDCVDGLCLPKVGSDVSDVPDIPAVEAFDTLDQGPPPTPQDDCKPCQGQGDCAAGFTCAPVAGSKYCLRECNNDGDCKGGYICYQVVSPGPKNCLPVAYQCKGCAYEGCDPGKCCDLMSGDCKDCLDECGKCIYDFECKQGYRCYRPSGKPTGNCVAECANAACPDPAKFSCGDNGKGVMVCIPKDDKVCEACPADKPYTLPDGTCVQCLNTTHCSQGQVCDQTTHQCRDAECSSGTYKCADGICHQCCEDAHCVGLPGATGKCVNYKCEGAQDPCGGTCADPYPVCANVGGIWQCVQCAVDADCKIPNCKCSNNLCVDASTGAVCQTGAQCGVECASDEDCPPGQSGEVLKCNTTYRTCYKPGGGCDGVSACCAPGQQCFDLLGLLFGGGIGFPGMPGMPMAFGYCSCNTQQDCLGGEPCTPMALVCALPLVGQIICPSGQLPPTVPQNMCFDISNLLGGLLP